MDEFEALALAAAAHKRKQSTPSQRNEDGTYGQPPEGMFVNPGTGQMTSREMIATNTDSSMGGTVARGIGAGVTFGLDDEAQALGAFVRGGPELGRFRLEQARAQQDVDAEQHPVASTGGKIAGALVPAAGSAPLAVGKSLLGTMGRGAFIGGIEGAAHGAGGGEGLDGRVNGSLWGGSVGGLVGGGAPAVIGALKGVLNPAIAAFTRKPSETKVRRALVDALQQSGRTADDVAAEVAEAGLEGQGEFRLMDALREAGQRRASGLVRAGGDGGAELAEFLEKRQLGQPERVAGFIDDAFGMGGETAQARAAALTAARGQAADAAYDAARSNAAPVDVRSALRVIDDRIGGMQGSGVTGDGIDAKLVRYRSRLAAPESKLPEGEIARELSDFDRVLGVKQAVQDDIGAAVRAGRNNEARELGKLVAALDEALEGASEGYRAANDSFRNASQVIGAVDEGVQMARPRQRAADTIARFQSMTPEQQSAARVGYGDTLLARLEAANAPTSNRAKALQSPKVEAESGAMSVDPSLLSRRIDRENAMWSVQNRALGGSRTADNLADIEATERTTSGLAGALADLANLNAGTAVQKAIGAIGPLVRGENDATRHALARALMSADPQAVLSPAVRKQFQSNVRDGLVAALMRQPVRESFTP
ncbi:hypothetical protein P5P81_03270 [Tritonibacter mobilis]|nr:hypothetical protein [Tritonibacter mobilis]